jgi:hypothetical protein
MFKIMKKLILFFAIFLFTIAAYSQASENTWYFSNMNGLDFSSGSPVSTFGGGLEYDESCAIQSDSSGNVLFYTNGLAIYKNTDTAINTVPILGGSSSMKGVIIVPNPFVSVTPIPQGKDTNSVMMSAGYYVFTKGQQGGGFRYSTVGVVGTTASIGNQNIPMPPPSNDYEIDFDGAAMGGEGIAAMPHCGGYYIITSLVGKNGNFYLVVYNLSASTGDLTFRSSYDLGISSPNATSSPLNINALEISPNGNKVFFNSAYGNNQNFLLDFDKSSGQFSNQISFDNIGDSVMGVCFSNDSNLLYLNGGTELQQYNLNSPNIVNDRIVVNPDHSDQPQYFGQFQRGPDGKIYMSKLNNTLAVINEPNNLCSPTNVNNCNFVFNGVFLQGGTHWGLPNMIDTKIETAYNNTISAYKTDCNTFIFFANACDTSFSWNFGDPASGGNNVSNDALATHTFSGNGVFTVTLYDSNNIVIATSILTSNCTGSCLPNLIFNNTQPISTVVYNASNTIITNLNYLVNAGSNISLIAENSINLGSNSHIVSGSNFLAKIDNCPATGKIESKSKSRITDKKQLRKDTFTLYPNPASDFINITSDTFETKTVTIYNVLGKVVLVANVTNAPINVASLSKGVYVVRVTEEGKTATRKLVIE